MTYGRIRVSVCRGSLLFVRVDWAACTVSWPERSSLMSGVRTFHDAVGDIRIFTNSDVMRTGTVTVET